MRQFLVTGLLAATVCGAVLPAHDAQSKVHVQDRVDLELMTWPELKDAIAHGRTTALVYNGGTETRGPQAVNGGHNLRGARQSGRYCARAG